jgi:branched-chain amino acid transport system permease protein
MEYFLQQLINGITLGSIYGLIAIGYTMVYGIIGMINFAHGDVFMVGAFAALVALLVIGIGASSSTIGIIAGLLGCLVFAMLIASVFNWTIERLAYRPLRGSFRLAPLISAIGMSLVLQESIRIAQGARPRNMPAIITGGHDIMTRTGEAGEFVVKLSNIQIVIVLTTIALMVLFTLIITKTSLGRAQRSCEQDMKMASLVGVDVNRTISITFVMGAALAAVAGLMYFLYYGQNHFFDGFLAGVKAFTAAVLGGIGSIPGAMLGGLIIGLIEVMWSGYFTVVYKDVAAFTMLAVTLIFLPQGILGKPEVEKV